MKMNMYSVFDKKAEAFFQPYLAPTHGVGLRLFQQLAVDNTQNVGLYPEDFELFHIATFENSSALVEPVSPPLSLGLATQFKTEQ